MEPPPQIVIAIGRQLDGIAFELDPRTRSWLEAAYPHVSRPAQVFVGRDSRSAFDALRDEIVRPIAAMLTGLDEAEIDALGGYQIYDPAAREFVQAAP